MTPEEFRTVGHQIIDWIADYRTQIADHPVMSTIEPGDVNQSKLSANICRQPG